MATRADIVIAVQGIKQVQRAQNSIGKLSTQINNLNKSASRNLFKKVDKDIGSLVLSTNNLNRLLSDARENFNSVAVGTPQATKAAKQFVKQEQLLNKTLAEQDKLLESVRRKQQNKQFTKDVRSKKFKKNQIAQSDGTFLNKRRQELQLINRADTLEARINQTLAKRGKILSANGKQIINNNKARTTGVAGSGLGSRFASAGQSAIISGAFPLLFGQGPLVAGAGAIGGGVGGMFGQMGGFAGGLAATSAATAIQNFSVEISKLGQALNARTKDVAAVVKSLGVAGTQFDENIQVLQKLGLEEEAFAAARNKMINLIGNDGVEAVTNFGKDFQVLGNQFAKIMTLMKGKFAEFIENSGIMQFLIGNVERNALLGQAEASGQTGDSEEAKNLKKLIADRNKLTNVLGKDALSGREKGKFALDILGKEKGSGVFGAANIKDLQDAKKLIEDQIVANQLLINQATEKKDLETTINDISVGKVNDLKEEFDFKQKLLPMSKEEREIETEIQKIRDIIKQIKGEEATFDEKAIRDQLEKNKGLEKELELTQKVEDAFKSLSNSINNDIKEGIKGLIKGTSTLGDMLNNIADKFLDLALNQGLFGSILGSQGDKGGGILGKLKLFADGGRPPVNRPSIVGEKGPELFVPRSSGNIIPNNKLGGGNTNNVVVNVDASGSDVQGDEAAAKEIGTLISVAVQGELLKQQRPGGLLSR